MNLNSNLTVFSDHDLTWTIDLDAGSVDPAPSIYIKSEGIEIRQFCTTDQLKALRDKLNELFEWTFVPSKDVDGKAVPECW